MTTIEDSFGAQVSELGSDAPELFFSESPGEVRKMEWRINIDQCVFQELIDAGFEVDLVDAVIVSGIQKLQDEEAGALLKTDDGLVWVGHKWFTRHYPLLGLNERGLRNRLTKLCKSRLLQRTHMRSSGAGFRKKACYRTTAMYQQLVRWWDKKRDVLADKEMHPNQRKAALKRLQDSKPVIEHQPMEVSAPRPRTENGRFTKVVVSPSYPPTETAGTDVPSAPSESCHRHRHDDAADSLFEYHESEEPKSKGNATTVASPPRGFWYREYEGDKYPVSNKNWNKLIEKLGGNEEEALSVVDRQFLRKAAYGQEEDVKDYAWIALQFVDTEYYKNDLRRQ